MIQRNQLARSADSPLIKYGLPVLVIVVGFVIYGILMRFQQPPKTADTATVIPVVTVEAARAFTGNIEIEANGLAMASREIELAAEVEGRIKTKEEICNVGRVVKKDDTLIVIDSENLEKT